jgi:hypothetical protein
VDPTEIRELRSWREEWQTSQRWMWITVGLMFLTAVGVYVAPQAAFFLTLGLPITVFQATRYWVKAARKRGHELQLAGARRTGPVQILLLGVALIALLVGVMISDSPVTEGLTAPSGAARHAHAMGA